MESIANKYKKEFEATLITYKENNESLLKQTDDLKRQNFLLESQLEQVGDKLESLEQLYNR